MEIANTSINKSKTSKRTINSSTTRYSKPLAVPKSGDLLRVNKRERVVTILNSKGEDVTPLSLSQKKNADGSMSTVDISSAVGSITDILNQLEGLTGGSNNSLNTSTTSKSFASSKMMVSVNRNQSFGGKSESESSHYSIDKSIATSIAAITKDIGNGPPLPGISYTTPKVADPENLISIDLLETETCFILDIPSTVVSSENFEESARVKAQNAKYNDLLASNHDNNDKNICKHTQTLIPPVKNKEISTCGNMTADAEVNTESWDIFDAYVVEEEEELTENQKANDIEAKITATEVGLSVSDVAGTAYNSRTASEMSISVMGSSKSFIGMSVAPDSNGSSVASMNLIGFSSNSLAKERHPVVSKQEDLLLKVQQILPKIDHESLIEKLCLMERAIVSNNYARSAIAFRNARDCGADERKRVKRLLTSNDYEEFDRLNGISEVNDVATIENSNLVPQLKLLWDFKCELTTGRAVSSVSWNKANEDILAVGYGESKVSPNLSPGLILVWSAKNLEWPDRVYNCNYPVTSLDFSKNNSFLLAAGLADGGVVMYDIRQRKDKIILDGGDGEGKHRGPIWELKWIERERVVGDEQSRDESLVSVSSDGRVTQWSIKKGLKFTDLMVLKRVSKQKTNQQKNSGASGSSFIARNSGGLCFDFNSKDSSTYIVGTEDGQIHKCSCSYNEQYLSSYSAHSGPVNKVKWSPFLHSVFLSCSSDWTSKLWNQENETEIFNFQSGKEVINDIAWSTHSATVFGTVSANGKLQLWDLECSVLDPLITLVADKQLSCINFALRSPTVLTGDDNGSVSVYKICKGKKDVDQSEETDDGIISPVAQLPPHHIDQVQWRAKEAQKLQDVMSAKLSNAVA